MSRILLMAPLAWACVLWLVAGPAQALDGLTPGPEAVVKEVVDGDTVILATAIDGADQVRLTGIQAPKLPLGRRGFRQWPLAPEAKAAMEALCLGKRVRLHFGGRRVDRHGRLLAHVETADGVWLQGAMLERGLARVYTFADNRRLASRMYALERAARRARRGIWAHPFYAVRAADDTAGLLRLTNTFQLVEGRVADAARVKGRLFLNFGDNWRDDFTIRVDKRPARLFAKDGLTAGTYAGRRVRVRGWVKDWNGPMVEVSHPEQIEILDKDQ